MRTIGPTPQNVETGLVYMVDETERNTGRRPAFLQVAPDVYAAAERAAEDSYRYLGGGPTCLMIDGIPVRRSRRLPPGWIVPVLPLPHDA